MFVLFIDLCILLFVRLYFESRPCFEFGRRCVGARIDPGLSLLHLFTFFELFLLFLGLCIFLCLVLSDVSPEVNTGRSGKTVSGFRSPLSHRVPILNFVSTVYFIHYR